MDYSRLTKVAAPAFFLAAAAGLSLLFRSKPSLELLQSSSHHGKRLSLLKGDPSLCTSTALIIPNTSALTCDTHIARLVLKAAGSALDRECHNWVLKFGKLIPGECATTGPGRLAVEYVIHIVPPSSLDWGVLAGALHNALITAGTGVGAKTVAVTEVGWKRDMRPEDYGKVLVEECLKVLAGTEVEEILIICREPALLPVLQALVLPSTD